MSQFEINAHRASLGDVRHRKNIRNHSNAELILETSSGIPNGIQSNCGICYGTARFPTTQGALSSNRL